jgi:hypothetical protein
MRTTPKLIPISAVKVFPGAGVEVQTRQLRSIAWWRRSKGTAASQPMFSSVGWTYLMALIDRLLNKPPSFVTRLAFGPFFGKTTGKFLFPFLTRGRADEMLFINWGYEEDPPIAARPSVR